MEIARAKSGLINRRALKTHPYALPFITILATFTISTSSVTILSIPRPTAVAVLATVFLLYAVRLHIQARFWQFAVAYLLAFIPGTIYNINDPTNIKMLALAQFLALLITFCALATYFSEWLTLSSDRTKVKWIHIILIYFFVISVLELSFYSEFVAIRGYLYHSANASVNEIMGSMGQREVTVYGGRPMAFFSEPSNFAKYLSVIIATYMAITNCSRRSLFAFLLFFVLVRSVSYFYAAPALVIALSRAFLPRTMFRRSGIRISGKLRAALGIGALLIAAIVYTQGSRISSGTHGQDGSLAERIQLPLRFLFTHPSAAVMGLGVTPQRQVESYASMMRAVTTNSVYAPGVSSAVSSTIMLIAGTGLVGICLFFIVMFLFQRFSGVWLVIAFIVSNSINGGFNAPPTIIPTALLVALMVYQFRLAKQDRARYLAAADPVLVAGAA